MAAPVNDVRSNATPVVIAANGDTFTAVPTLNTEATHNYVSDNGPDDFAEPARKSVWWTYTAADSDTVTLTATATGNTHPVYLIYYKLDADGIRTGNGTAVANSSPTSFFCFEDQRVDISMVQLDPQVENGVTYGFTMTGPRSQATDDPPVDNVDVEAFQTGVGIGAATASSTTEDGVPVLGFTAGVLIGPAASPPPIDRVPVPVINAEVQAGLGVPSLMVPSANVSVQTLVPEADTYALTLSSPDPDEVVATAFPQFMVGMETGADAETAYTLEVQYDSSAAFDASPVTLSEDIIEADGGAALVPTVAVPDTTWWHARLLKDGLPLAGWSRTQKFTVDVEVSAAEIVVSFTVSAGAARPIHLWHFVPPGAEVGEQVTAYGQGFPTSMGNVTVAGVVASIESWELVDEDTTGQPQSIDGGTVTPEHFEVVFTVPDIEEPGGPVVVEA